MRARSRLHDGALVRHAFHLSAGHLELARVQLVGERLVSKGREEEGGL
jgi:hypothetical protein